MMFDIMPTPKAVPAFAGKRILDMACGVNHAIAYDDAGCAYTWGNGGYGRLGHRVRPLPHPARTAHLQELNRC